MSVLNMQKTFDAGNIISSNTCFLTLEAKKRRFCLNRGEREKGKQNKTPNEEVENGLSYVRRRRGALKQHCTVDDNR